LINYRFDTCPSPEANLLVHSMILGLESVEEEVEDNTSELNSYIDINFKEV
jgi:hypothetical protein